MMKDYTFVLNNKWHFYWGIHERGSNDVVSAVCVQRAPIVFLLGGRGIDRECIKCNKQLRRHHPNHFREFPSSIYP